MKRITYPLAITLACVALSAWAGNVMAVDEPAKVAGTWEMTTRGRSRTITQTLKIQQNGNTIKGTLTGQNGEAVLQGSVTANKIRFTVKQESFGGSYSPEYSATIDGDSMKGTVHSERFVRSVPDTMDYRRGPMKGTEHLESFDGEFTAKRRK
jgi:hypothetical protein